MENYIPLVSVIVITYNSSKFVLETLESIKNQTYSNIELIISDDCSTDETINICQNWLYENKNRFKNTELIISKKNTGIPANCNRGFDKANGEWIKNIAGDDCLYPNAIEEYMNYVNNNNTEIVFSSMNLFQNNFKESSKIESHISPLAIFKSNKAKALDQFNFLAFGNAIYAPSVFIKKDLFFIVNKYDEDIKLCEDWPMWLKITQMGYTFYYIDKPLVKYRIHQQSTWAKQSIGKKYILIDGEDIIKNKYIYPYIPLLNRLILKLEYKIRKQLNINSDNYLYKLLFIFCNKFICHKRNKLCQKFQ